MSSMQHIQIFYWELFYFDEIYVLLETNGVHMCSSYQKLNVPHWKTNIGQKALSYVGPSTWNNLTKTSKTSTSLNAFKHNIKQNYELKKRVLMAVFVLLMFQSIFNWILLSICITLKSFLLYLSKKTNFLFLRDDNEDKAFTALFCVFPANTLCSF